MVLNLYIELVTIKQKQFGFGIRNSIPRPAMQSFFKREKSMKILAVIICFVSIISCNGNRDNLDLSNLQSSIAARQVQNFRIEGIDRNVLAYLSLSLQYL